MEKAGEGAVVWLVLVVIMVCHLLVAWQQVWICSVYEFSFLGHVITFVLTSLLARVSLLGF